MRTKGLMSIMVAAALATACSNNKTSDDRDSTHPESEATIVKEMKMTPYAEAPVVVVDTYGLKIKRIRSVWTVHSGSAASRHAT